MKSVPQHFRLSGSARHLPSTSISAADLDGRLGLEPGWTFRHTGIHTRYQATGAETGATMAKTVVEAAVSDAGCTIADIDLIVDASLSVQQPIPCNAALIQQSLGPAASGIPCIDVHASCLGFLAALQVVNGLFAGRTFRRAVIVCSETPLNGVNWQEPDSACLMGDGAAAVVVEAVEPSGNCVFKLETFAQDAELCHVKGGGHRLPAYLFTDDQSSKFRFHMDGKALHRAASRYLPPMIGGVLEMAGCELGDLHIIPHQASVPSIEFLARRLRVDRSRLHSSVAEHGNLVAAGIPFVLHEVRRRQSTGERVMLVGTAAGYTQGCVIFTL